MRYLTLSIIALLILAACTNEPVSTVETATPTQLPEATATPEPTSTPLPSPTVGPTAIPIPTPTFSPGRVILPTPAPRTPTPSPTLEDTLKQIGSRTALLRNLFAIKPIENEFVTSTELRSLLQKELEEERDEILESQELLVTLGILGEEVDYYDLLVGVYSETVLGFFDTEEEKMFVVDDDDDFGPEDAFTYAHEYVHGLQQQHFDIKSIQEGMEGNNDQSLAFQAVTEGDAVIAQTLYFIQHFDTAEQGQIVEASGNTEAALLDASPRLIQRLIGFPYIGGPFFIQDAYIGGDFGWDIIDGFYENPPKSTEQVLHPEKYYVEEDPIIVNLPDLSTTLGEGWNEISTNIFGEFFLLAYLETWIERADAVAAANAAAGWGGDSYTLLKGPDDEKLLVVSVAWDTEDDSQEFFDFFSQVMINRTDLAWQSEGEGASSQIMNLENQSIYIELDAANTLIIYAPNAGVLEVAKSAFAEL